MTQVTKMLIQANTLQMTYLPYNILIINVSNLSAYMSRQGRGLARYFQINKQKINK